MRMNDGLQKNADKIEKRNKGLGLSQQTAFCPQKAMLAGTQQFYSPFVEFSNLTVTP